MTDTVVARSHTTLHPDATEVLPAGAERESWLRTRQSGIGGSDVSAILGLSRFSTARDIYRAKWGIDPQRPPSWPMMRGTLLEPGLVEWFTRETGAPVSHVGTLRNTERPWMQYNPDGLLTEPAVLECKTTGHWGADEWADGQTADHAELQVQWGMAVTGLPKAYVIVAISDSDPEIREVQRDDELIPFLIKECGIFWRDHVIPGVEPAVTYRDLSAVKREHPDVTKAAVTGGPDIDDAVKRHTNAALIIKAYKEIQQQAEAEIIQTLGDAAHLVINGEIAAARTGFDRAGYTVKPSHITRLTVPSVRKPYKGN